MVISSVVDSRFFHPYYFIHLMLLGSYFPMRVIFDIPNSPKFNGTDTLSFGLTREQQIFSCALLFFLFKRTYLTTMDAILHRIFTSFKFCVLAISLAANSWMFAFYLIFITIISFGIAQPEYDGECDFIIFKDRQDFYNNVECAPQDEAWLVFFYFRWASDCGQFTPTFCGLSLEYGKNKKYLKFGKLDVSVCPGYAKKYNVSIKASTKQLPTLILFQNGKEILRMPDFIDTQKTKVKKLPLKYDTVAEYFKLKEYSEGGPKNKDKNTKKNNDKTKSKETQKKSNKANKKRR